MQNSRLMFYALVYYDLRLVNKLKSHPFTSIGNEFSENALIKINFSPNKGIYMAEVLHCPQCPFNDVENLKSILSSVLRINLFVYLSSVTMNGECATRYSSALMATIGVVNF